MDRIQKLRLADLLSQPFSIQKMRVDLQIFKKIRFEANSGLFKHRSISEIEALYEQADARLNKLSSLGDFYNLIVELTDFEGSLHNNTKLPIEITSWIEEEEEGFFPYPIKVIENRLIVNFRSADIPLGAIIETVNGQSANDILSNLSKYYTTDGRNISGKTIGVNKNFAKYFRYYYGPSAEFEVSYRKNSAAILEQKTIAAVPYTEYYNNFKERHSLVLDKYHFKTPRRRSCYQFERIDVSTGVLTLHSFEIGKTINSEEHFEYVHFLESTFKNIKQLKLTNLIIDVRNNSGGTEPNDVVTYSYLAQRRFQENKRGWVRYVTPPFRRYLVRRTPRILQFFQKKKEINLRKLFPLQRHDGYYQTKHSFNHRIRKPKHNRFTGNIFLLISPRVASAGSLFAAMVAGNSNTVVIGEETMGGYYGQNGHYSVQYRLPNSGIVTRFSIVNIDHDVEERENQLQSRGVMPDHLVQQTIEDFKNNVDTQMEYTLKLIKRNY